MFNDLILTPRATKEEAREMLDELMKRGVIVGTDEAGRGALAGPVMAASVYLTPEQEQKLIAMRIRDSKQMLPNRREKMFAAMNEMGILWRAYSGSIERIERDNILVASLWTMGKSVEDLTEVLPEKPRCVIVDGTERIPNLKLPQWTLIDADKLIPAVSAASVIAKVLRDRLMVELDAKYPGYDLATNKGYPTPTHIARVREMGITEVHRPYFCETVIRRGRK